MTDLTTFNVSDVLEIIGTSAVPRGAGLSVSCSGIDDLCYGCVVSSDKTFTQFLQQHKGPYNFIPFETAGTTSILLKRIAVDSELTIDLELNESHCISRNGAPSIQFVRTDPATLPRSVEIQYQDPDRAFEINTQIATYHAAPLSNGTLSVPIDFVISADQAREMAFDYLYRIWAQQVGLVFEYRDTRIEPGDVLNVTAGARVYTAVVMEQTLTRDRTSMVKAVALLASRGIIIAGGSVTASTQDDDFASFLYST